MIYKKPKQPWTIIDDHLRIAILKRNVTIKFLVNDHATHANLMFDAIKSLMKDMNQNGQIHVAAKMFIVSLKIEWIKSLLFNLKF